MVALSRLAKAMLDGPPKSWQVYVRENLAMLKCVTDRIGLELRQIVGPGGQEIRDNCNSSNIELEDMERNRLPHLMTRRPRELLVK